MRLDGKIEGDWDREKAGGPEFRISCPATSVQFWGIWFHVILQKHCKYKWASPRGHDPLAWRLGGTLVWFPIGQVALCWRRSHCSTNPFHAGSGWRHLQDSKHPDCTCDQPFPSSRRRGWGSPERAVILGNRLVAGADELGFPWCSASLRALAAVLPL